MTTSLVLDAGALIGIDRRSTRSRSCFTELGRVLWPSSSPRPWVAPVVRSGGRQANLRRFLADSYLTFAGLDYPTALRFGALLGESGTTDVVDACVAVCAVGSTTAR